jgi:hypothetical protein
MQQSNFAYKHDADTGSSDEVPLNRQSPLSPGQIQRASDQADVRRCLNLLDKPISVINKKQQNDNSLGQYALTIGNKQNNLPDDDSYYSLQRLLERRRGVRAEDSKLSRRVKQFYKDQDELIDVYEREYKRGSGDGDDELVEKQQQHIIKMTDILTKVSLVANIVRICYVI